MTNFSYVDAQNTIKYLKAGGVGTDAEPQVIEHKDVEAIVAIQSANDRLDIIIGLLELVIVNGKIQVSGTAVALPGTSGPLNTLTTRFNEVGNNLLLGVV